MAKRIRAWVAPRTGGYAAVTSDKRGADKPRPPRGPAAVAVPADANKKGSEKP